MKELKIISLQSYWIGILLFMIILLLNKAKKYQISAFLIYALFILIAGVYYSQFSTQTSFTNADLGKGVNWIGEVESVIDKKEGYNSFLVRVNRIKEDKEWVDQSFLVDFKTEKNQLNIVEGSLISSKSNIQNYKAPLNPKQFSYKDFRAKKGVFYYSFEDDYLVHKKRLTLKSIASSLRKRIIEAYREVGIKGEELGVLIALSLGDKTQLNYELKESYASAGAMHILAVSGLHVGIIFLLFSWLLNIFPNTTLFRWTKALVLILVIWGYAILTGLSPSVQRASLMFSFIIISKAINRNSNVINSISGSALVLLLINPNLLFDVGFQLSYSAVYGIVIIYPLVYSWLSTKYFLIDKIWSLTVVSVSATISTLPFTLFYFHQFPNWFFITNLFVIPLAFIVVGGGVLVGGVWQVFNHDLFLGKLLQFTIWLLNQGVDLVNNLPFAVTQNIWLKDVTIVIIASSIIFLVIYLYTIRKRFIYASLCFIILGLIIEFLSAYNQSTKKFIGVYALKGSPIVCVDGLWAEVIVKQGLSLFENRVIQNHMNSIGVREIEWNFYLISEADRKNRLLHKLGKDIIVLFNQDQLEIYNNHLSDFLLINESNDTSSIPCVNEVLSYDFPIWKTPNATINKSYLHSLKQDGYFQENL